MYVGVVTQERSKDILAAYNDADFSLLEYILTQKIKPIFQGTPHPDVNLSTGRKMPRPAGGSAAFHDHFERQVWKERLGIVETLSWCVRHTQVRSVHTVAFRQN